KFITYAVWWIRQAILHALSEQGGAFRLPPKRANLMYRLEKAIATAITDGNHMPTPDELATELGVTVKEVQTLLQANSDNFSLSAELDEDSHTALADMIEQTTIPSAEDEMQEQSRREELLAHISELSPKERLVLTLRHGVTDNFPKRVDELAQFFNRENAYIRGLLDAAKAKVCEGLGLSESELSQLLEQKTILKLRYGVLQDDELTLRDIGEILGLSRERVRQIESRAEAKCRRSVRRADR